MEHNELEQPIDEIRKELEFARALTALMMTVQLDFEETISNRVEFRVKERHDKVNQELRRLAS